MTPRGIIDGAIGIICGRIVAIRRSLDSGRGPSLGIPPHGLPRGASRAPRGAKTLNVHGAYVAPGFIDAHVWGDSQQLSRELVKQGTTAFLCAIGPGPRATVLHELARTAEARGLEGAQCLGAHLEGPFLNPAKGGALPKRWMRRPTAKELQGIDHSGVVRLMTIAPELPGALEAIRWCRRRGVVASLGHSVASVEQADRAVDAGAGAVTHVFNGMPLFHHRRPSLLDVALTDSRLTAMVILDGVHVSPETFRLLVKAKGIDQIALVTDSIQRQGWDVVKRRGAYYTKSGTLAGSCLTMMDAVRNAVRFGGVSISDAVRMGSEVPARLLGDRTRGMLAVGKKADLMAFDKSFRVLLTMVGGRIIYQR